jgi:hypothetical protein
VKTLLKYAYAESVHAEGQFILILSLSVKYVITSSVPNFFLQRRRVDVIFIRYSIFVIFKENYIFPHNITYTYIGMEFIPARICICM